MERPIYELVNTLLHDHPLPTDKADALYRLAWLADNFNYSNIEQAREIMRETLPELAK